MTAYDFVHLSFLALGGEIKGKTKVQKMIYFLGLMTEHDDDLGYRPHYYGPYSDDVAEAVERLKTLGFLDQSVSGAGAVDSRGFEVARCDYRLNCSGTRVAQTKAEQYHGDWGRIQEAVKALKEVFAKDYMELSIAAKTWFMLGEKRGKASMADLETLAPKFGWSVTPEQVQAAAKLLAEAELVKLT